MRLGAEQSFLKNARGRANFGVVTETDVLKVGDTSIMPTLVSGNTNGLAMMIRLKAAELILS